MVNKALCGSAYSWISEHAQEPQQSYQQSIASEASGNWWFLTPVRRNAVIMKRGVFAIIVLLFLVLSISAVQAELSREDIDEIQKQAEDVKDFIDKLKNTKADKYNRVHGTVVDENGKPVSCTLRVFYNDYYQEEVPAQGGSFDARFNHGSIFPTAILSVALRDCPCTPVRIVPKDPKPKFPELDDLLERLKKIAEEKAMEKGQEAVQEGLEKAFERAMGPAGGAFAQYYIEGIKAALEGISKIQSELRRFAGEAKLTEPAYPGANKLTQGILDRLFGWHKPTTEFEFKLIVKCNGKEGPISFVPIGGMEEDDTTRQPPVTGTDDDISTPPLPPRLPPVTTGPEPTFTTGPRTIPKRTDCPECNVHLERINALEKELGALQNELSAKQKELSGFDAKIRTAKDRLEASRRRLNEFDNPRNWAESEGRRVTQTDIEVRRAASQRAWDRYRSGEISAQELSDEWANMDDETLEQLKKEAREKLVKEIADSEKALNALEAQKQALSEVIAKLRQRMEDLLQEITKEKQKYEDCLRRCKGESKCGAYKLFDTNDCGGSCTAGEYCMPRVQVAEGRNINCYHCVPKPKSPACGDLQVGSRETCDPPGKPCRTAGSVGVCTDDCQCRPITGTSRPPVTLPPSEPLPPMITGPQTTETPPVAPPDCNKLCGERGLSTTPTDHSSFIMSSLSQYSCVSGVSIKSPGATTLQGPGFSCKCYSSQPPQISVDTRVPVCDTPCGPVACGSSAECPCPDRPNCVLTSTCGWKGWRIQNGRPVPVVGGG
jgi:hypothetical protein